MSSQVIRLKCGTKSYDWGKIGHDSAVARFAAASHSSGSDTIEPKKPYAELWMGSHSSCPSRDIMTGLSLQDLLVKNPSFVSRKADNSAASSLPFLFKVLSIQNALSIQAHPDRKLAEKLHRINPKAYPDDNHKPEIAIAITHFEGLCGFRPLTEIMHFLNTIQPLRDLVGDSVTGRLSQVIKDDVGTQVKTAVLKEAFAALMNSTMESISNQVPKLIDLATSSSHNFDAGSVTSPSSQTLFTLVTRLYHKFGADIGLFVLFFLNYIALEPGEAMFLDANNIHAYLSGDIIECMAASDNVVRAGLTPKFKDTATLIDMLTYNSCSADEQKLVAVEYPRVVLQTADSRSNVRLYEPPIEDFSVVRTVLHGDNATATFASVNGPSIIICTSGKGHIAVDQKSQSIEEGFVFFIASGTSYAIESNSGSDEFITFKAFCEFEDPVV